MCKSMNAYCVGGNREAFGGHAGRVVHELNFRAKSQVEVIVVAIKPPTTTIGRVNSMSNIWP